MFVSKFKPVFFLFIAIAVTCVGDQAMAQSWEVESGFRSLFNGSDLTGWSYLPTTEAQKKGRARWLKNDPNAPAWPIVEKKVDFAGKASSESGRFVAQDGMLVVTVPDAGRTVQMLYTSEDFTGDFTLKLEFRAAENADSGVFIKGKQLQCRDFPNAGPYKELKNYKPGDWNELVIVVTGTQAHCSCNGEVLEAEFVVPESGPIGVEGDRGKIEYRRIQIADGNLRATNEVSSWKLEQTGDGLGDIKSDKEAIIFTTTEVGEENWHVQAYQAGLALEEGKEYTVSFEIKSSDECTVTVQAMVNQEDWHNIGLHEEIYTGDEYEKCEFSFTADGVTKNNNRIGFVLGDAKGSVSIKNLRLTKSDD